MLGVYCILFDYCLVFGGRFESSTACLLIWMVCCECLWLRYNSVVMLLSARYTLVWLLGIVVYFVFGLFGLWVLVIACGFVLVCFGVCFLIVLFSGLYDYLFE